MIPLFSFILGDNMNIYQHFRTEEREFIDMALQWMEYVEQTYSSKLTDFLDPREQQIVQAVVGSQSEIQVAFFGGQENNERKRALIYPEYLQVERNDFHIRLFEIEYPVKFVTIEHPQVLGSLMALGLKRGKFGDILIHDGRIQFLVTEEISEYIKLQLTQIGRASVTLKELPSEEGLVIEGHWQEMTATVSSLRLDTVLAALLNLSRQRAQELIRNKRVKVNWTTIENPSFECGVADILSVRGFGRLKLISIEGKTKKDKWRIVGGKQK